jgi:hypothetical protein
VEFGATDLRVQHFRGPDHKDVPACVTSHGFGAWADYRPTAPQQLGNRMENLLALSVSDARRSRRRQFTRDACAVQAAGRPVRARSWGVSGRRADCRRCAGVGAEIPGSVRGSGADGYVPRGPVDVRSHHGRRLFHVSLGDRHHDLSMFQVAAKSHLGVVLLHAFQ